MPVQVDINSIPSITKKLLGGAPMTDLQAHFEKLENKHRFKMWQKERRKRTNDTTNNTTNDTTGA